MVNIRILICLSALFCGYLTCRAQDVPDGAPPPPDGQYAQSEQDPPTRAARLSYYNGSVSMEPAGIDDWAPVEVNRPFTTGDYLYADQKSVAELQLDSAVFRLGEVTSFGFLNLNDQIAQLKLTEGDLYFRVHDLAPSQVYEIDTPNAAISLLRNGVYRIHVDPDANTTLVVVREGQAEVTGGGQAFTLNPEQSANLSGTNELAYDIEQAPAPDALDQWSMQRDQQEMQASATRYVPPSMIGYSDLDRYGSWTEAPDYGPVWYPTSVPDGWAPYHTGHWAWIAPWGWTWVDAQPWAFAPCHYGRWVYWRNRWGWAPGPVAVVSARPIRPIYAPALVAWFGGAHWGVSVGIGGGPALGWVPLGFGEIYTPAYHCGPTYFRNVNVYNTRVVNNVNITNVYRTVYVQKTVYNQNFVNMRAPHSVVAVPANGFAAGRPIQEIGRPVNPALLSRVRPGEVHVIAPQVVPTRTGVAALLGRPAPHPNPTIISRPIVARVAQPARIVPFEQRQQFVQQHAGQPVNFAALHQQFQAQARPVAIARVMQQPRPVQVHTGERVGSPPPVPQARPAPQPEIARQPGNPPPPHGVPPNRRPNSVMERQNIPGQPTYGQTQPRVNQPANQAQQPVRQVQAPPQQRQQVERQQQEYRPPQHGVAPTPQENRGYVAPRQEQQRPPAETHYEVHPQPAPPQHGVAPNPQENRGYVAPRQEQPRPPAETHYEARPQPAPQQHQEQRNVEREQHPAPNQQHQSAPHPQEQQHSESHGGGGNPHDGGDHNKGDRGR